MGPEAGVEQVLHVFMKVGADFDTHISACLPAGLAVCCFSGVPVHTRNAHCNYVDGCSLVCHNGQPSRFHQGVVIVQGLQMEVKYPVPG